MTYQFVELPLQKEMAKRRHFAWIENPSSQCPHKRPRATKDVTNRK